MSTRIATTLALVLFAPVAVATDFPTGTLTGVGFIVEKGSQRITDKDMHTYSSTVAIEKVTNSAYRFTIMAKLQRSPSTPVKVDRRVDIFNITWGSPTSGTMSNRDPTFQDDKSTFTISDTELVVRSWIARNQLWETHRYRLDKKPTK